MKKLLLFLALLCCAIMSCIPSNGEESTKPAIYAPVKEVSFAGNGGTQKVQVYANVEYDIASSVGWLTVMKDKNFVVNITASPSTHASERTGEIIFSNKEHNLSQTITVSQSSLNVNGWAELPAMVENVNWEYGHHSVLPSNNKLRNYSFCFDKERYCSIWVAYPLHECYLGDASRKDNWGYDPCCIADEFEPNLSGSYYSQGGGTNTHSRGHHLPSADRVASREDNLTTFYCTNVTPQLQSLNGGTWMSLEDALRGEKYMCKDTLYVVTGAHFEQGANYNYAWDNKGKGKACAVPTHYYKVVLRTKKGDSGKWVGNCSADELKCVGFWFEHKGGAPRQTMSVAEIEKKTGYTFFPNVPNAPKSTYNPSDWQ